uniref:Reverse transcriptase domain-containing protein n=1 Tax=Oreochromis aureus TaxID=47969 RepID=A0A668U248_OREAU
ADDVTVIIRNQNELQPRMMISLSREIKILGIWIDNTDSSLLNWNKKENEIKMEIMKWENKDTNYKTRINIVKTHIISKLLFLSTIFPPPRTTVMKISKMCIKFIWGSNREVTKRKLMYKSRKHGGLGAPDLEIVLTTEIRQKMTEIGFDVDVNIKAVKYGLFKEKMGEDKRRLFWLVMCVINTHIWKTRAKGVIEQKMISSDVVSKHIITDLRRRRTMDLKLGKVFPWNVLKL